MSVAATTATSPSSMLCFFFSSYVYVAKRYTIWFELSESGELNDSKAWLPHLFVPALDGSASSAPSSSSATLASTSSSSSSASCSHALGATAHSATADLNLATQWTTEAKRAFARQFPWLGWGSGSSGASVDTLQEWMLQHGTQCGGSRLWAVLPGAPPDELRWTFVCTAPELLTALNVHLMWRPLVPGSIFEHTIAASDGKKTSTIGARSQYQAVEVSKREILARPLLPHCTSSSISGASAASGSAGSGAGAARCPTRRAKVRETWFFKAKVKDDTQIPLWTIDGRKGTEGSLRVLVLK